METLNYENVAHNVPPEEGWEAWLEKRSELEREYLAEMTEGLS